MAPSLAGLELGSGDAADLAAMSGDPEWWADRSPAAVREALAGTDRALGARAGARLVASTRVVTDGTVSAVVVAADCRREGLGTDVMDHDVVADLGVRALRCREGLVPVYEAVGVDGHDPTPTVDGCEEAFANMTYTA